VVKVLVFLRKLRSKNIQPLSADIYISICRRGSYFRFARIAIAMEEATGYSYSCCREGKLWLRKLHYSRYDTGSTGGQYKIYVRCAICISDIFIIPDTSFWNNALRASAYKVRQIASVKDTRALLSDVIYYVDITKE